MAWSVIDHYLDKLLERLVNAPADKISAITTSASDTSQRCEMIKRLIVIENPGTEWRDWLIGLINRISGELAPARNRFIHDSWHIKDLKLIRIERRGKVGRPQSRTDITYSFDTQHVTDPKDVEKLLMKVGLLIAMLAFADYDLGVWRKDDRKLLPHDEYLEATKPNARYRTPAEHDEAIKKGTLRPESHYVFD